MMLHNLKFENIHPSYQARGTLNVCMRNPVAKKIIGKSLFEQLMNTYDVEINGKEYEIVVHDEDQCNFKRVIQKYDEARE